MSSQTTTRRRSSRQSHKTQDLPVQEHGGQVAVTTYSPLTPIDQVSPQTGHNLSQQGQGELVQSTVWLSLTPLTSQVSAQIGHALSQKGQVGQAELTRRPCDYQNSSQKEQGELDGSAAVLPLTPPDCQSSPSSSHQLPRVIKSCSTGPPKDLDIQTQSRLPRDISAISGPPRIIVKLPSQTHFSQTSPNSDVQSTGQDKGVSGVKHSKTKIGGESRSTKVSPRISKETISRHPLHLSEARTHLKKANTRKTMVKTDNRVSSARGRGSVRYDPRSLLPPTSSHTLDSPTITEAPPHPTLSSQLPLTQPTSSIKSASKRSRRGQAKPPFSSSRSLPVLQRQPSSTVAMASRYQHALRQDWKEWQEVAVRVSGLRRDLHITLKDIWAMFKDEGQISTIELGENERREGAALVRFSPPPRNAFWLNPAYRVVLSEPAAFTFYDNVQLDPTRSRRQKFLYINPKSTVQYPDIMTLMAESLDFGFLCQPTKMMTMCTVRTKDTHRVNFRLNLRRKEIDANFAIAARDARKRGRESQTKDDLKVLDFRFTIPLDQLTTVFETVSSDRVTWLISIGIPPKFFWKGDEERSFPTGAGDRHATTFWSQRDAWYRRTDICYDRTALRTSPLTLRKSNPIIDIGRWTTYRFCFFKNESAHSPYQMVRDALEEHNVKFDSLDGFDFVPKEEPPFWDHLSRVSPGNLSAPDKAVDHISLLEMQLEEQIAFPIRYQLEVCLSQGYLNEYNLNNDVVEQLMLMSPDRARDFLESIANMGMRCFEPGKALELRASAGLEPRPKLPPYCTFTRSATVTPTIVYYNTPNVETSNRVVRDFAGYGDRFLRVRFTDEKNEGKVYSSDNDTNNEIFTRIKRAMAHGILVGGRHFEFLAFGNSQFREHGAYFFARLPDMGPEHVRSMMGDFSGIRIVAKFAARLGQCFSTTRAIHTPKFELIEDDDVEDKAGHTFTDGVGKISQVLAKFAADELGLAVPPSAYQFRLGGCKGVLAAWPDVTDRAIHIRQSQYKFAANHEGLEINRWAQFGGAFLNRQVISVLSVLGVADVIFTDKMTQQLSDLEDAMTDPDLAEELLLAAVDANQMTEALAGMVMSGFQESREPFTICLLNLWRAWSTKYLKEKARLFVPEGAFLLGCTDETRTLQGHFTGRQVQKAAPYEDQLKALPEVFVQILTNHNDTPQVITGPMSLARNPSLHPGDIRVVRGVDIPQLHHLVNVVVLPQTGDRDLASMCSGGDLDGDDYLVMWDKALLPKSWNEEPMDYSAPSPSPLGRKVEMNDVHSFFVEHMKMDNLGKIATAHLAMSDLSAHGVRDKKCINLAQRHSMAVDYAKTGIAATLPRELIPKIRPHFMEPKRKEPYHSKKVLGQLYDQVERIDFEPELNAPFDKRILDAYPPNQQMLSDARDIKKQYDVSLRRIMAQHDIKTEFEVWSTFVLHHFNQNGDYKFHEVIGQLSSALKDQFRAACYLKAGGHEFEEIAPLVAAMYTVTNEETRQAVEECSQFRVVDGQSVQVRKSGEMPLISFPWVFHSVLGRIASGKPNSVHASKAEGGRARRKARVASTNVDDTLQTAGGETHRGQLLSLFRDSEPTNPPSQVDGSAGYEKMPTSKWLQKLSGPSKTKVIRQMESVSESSQGIFADLEGLDFHSRVPSPTGDAALSAYNELDLFEKLAVAGSRGEEALDSAGSGTEYTGEEHSRHSSEDVFASFDPASISPARLCSPETFDVPIIPPKTRAARSMGTRPLRRERDSGKMVIISETYSPAKSEELSPLDAAFPPLTIQAIPKNERHQPFPRLSITTSPHGAIAGPEKANKVDDEGCIWGVGERRAVDSGKIFAIHNNERGNNEGGVRSLVQRAIKSADESTTRVGKAHSKPEPPLDLTDHFESIHELFGEETPLPRRTLSEDIEPSSSTPSIKDDPWKSLAFLDKATANSPQEKVLVSHNNDEDSKICLRPTTPEKSTYDMAGFDFFERSTAGRGNDLEKICSPGKRIEQPKHQFYGQHQPRVSLLNRTTPRSVPRSHWSPTVLISSPMKQTPTTPGCCPGPNSKVKFPPCRQEDECEHCHFEFPSKGINGNEDAREAHLKSCTAWQRSALYTFNLPLAGLSGHRTSYSGSSDLIPDLALNTAAHAVASRSSHVRQENLGEDRDASVTGISRQQPDANLSSESSEPEEVVLDFNTSGRAAWARLEDLTRVDD